MVNWNRNSHQGKVRLELALHGERALLSICISPFWAIQTDRSFRPAVAAFHILYNTEKKL